MSEAALRVFANPPRDYDYINNALLCLALTRNIVQLSFGMTYDDFYSIIVNERVERDENNQPAYPIARDAERSMRHKWAVNFGDPEPGEVMFNYDAYPNKFGIKEGHVWAYIGVLPFQSNGTWALRRVVVESARPEWRRKDGSYLANNGCIVLSDLDKIKKITTRIRLPKEIQG